MLNAVPKTSEQVFPGSLKSMKGTFLDTRKTRRDATEPKTPQNKLSHLRALESYPAISSGGRPILRATLPRPQKTRINRDIHKHRTHIIRSRSQRRIHGRSRGKTRRNQSAPRSRVRIVLQKDNLIFLMKRR